MNGCTLSVSQWLDSGLRERSSMHLNETRWMSHARGYDCGVREWCVVVRPAVTASADERRRLRELFSAQSRQFDWTRQGDDVLVLVTDRTGLERVEADLMRVLRRRRLALAVEKPFPVGRWYPSISQYVVPPVATVLVDPLLDATELGWGVSVRPASAFDWRAARAALAERGRSTIGETEFGFDVGARDETDAHDLIAELANVTAIGHLDARPLSFLRRWRVRQHLLGNYSGIDDPSIPH
jgi:hypothetical protein